MLHLKIGSQKSTSMYDKTLFSDPCVSKCSISRFHRWIVFCFNARHISGIAVEASEVRWGLGLGDDGGCGLGVV